MGGKYVLIPLPGHEGQFFRLPRPFAEWMAEAGQQHGTDGRYYNYTDGKWIETDNADETRRNPTE
jgi:hypothetical protein